MTEPITAAQFRLVADKLAAYEDLVAALRDADTLPTPEGIAALAAARGITFHQTDTEIAEALVARYCPNSIPPSRVRDTLEAARGRLQREIENVAKIREVLGAGASESTLDAALRVVQTCERAERHANNALTREQAAHTILSREGVPTKAAELGGYEPTVPVRLETLLARHKTESKAQQPATEIAGDLGDSLSRWRHAASRQRETQARQDAQRADGERTGTVPSFASRIAALMKHDPRAAALAQTKLDECELWLSSRGA